MDLVASLPSQQPRLPPLPPMYESVNVSCPHPFYLNESVSDAFVLDPEMYLRQLTMFTLLQTMQEKRTFLRQLSMFSAEPVDETLSFRSIMESWVFNFSELYTRVLLTVGEESIWHFGWSCVCNPDFAARLVDFPIESRDDNGWMLRDVHHCTYTNGNTLLWIVHPATDENIEMELRDRDPQFTEKMIRLRWLVRKWEYECKWAGSVRQWQAMDMASLRLPL